MSKIKPIIHRRKKRKKKKSSSFGFKLYIFDQNGTRHNLCIYIMLSTSSCDKMTILENISLLAMPINNKIVEPLCHVSVIRNPRWVWYQFDRVFLPYSVLWIEKEQKEPASNQNEVLRSLIPDLEKIKKNNMSHAPGRHVNLQLVNRDIAIDVYILHPAHLSSNAYNLGGGALSRPNHM